MNTETATYAVSWVSEQSTGTRALQQEQQLNRFLAEVERRALRIAEIGVRDRDDALDLVQDAMIKLARKYGDRRAPSGRRCFTGFCKTAFVTGTAARPCATASWCGLDVAPAAMTNTTSLPLHPTRAVDHRMKSYRTARRWSASKRRYTTLPARQREAFMLRTFEGLDVAGTATAMGCSQGSVKTHYSRAIHSLRETLGEHGPQGSEDG